MKHDGFHTHRLSEKAGNPREVAFAAQWKEENEREFGTPLLDHLIPDATERDAKVAATIVQWLGSNVGMSFIEEVVKRSPEVRDYLRLSVMRGDKK